MKHRIGKIVKPRKPSWLTEDKLDDYLISLGWGNLKNSVIDGFIWTQYLNEYDYENIYLRDTENSKEEIIRQIMEQLGKSNLNKGVEGSLLISELEEFYYDMGEDWHLWDEEEKGQYPIQRTFEAMKKFIDHHKSKQ